jgi:hypothetical protein
MVNMPQAADALRCLQQICLELLLQLWLLHRL